MLNFLFYNEYIQVGLSRLYISRKLRNSIILNLIILRGNLIDFFCHLIFKCAICLNFYNKNAFETDKIRVYYLQNRILKLIKSTLNCKLIDLIGLIEDTIHEQDFM